MKVSGALGRIGAVRHAVPMRAVTSFAERLPRRGPITVVPQTSMDLAFKVGACGVTLAAAVLGVALGLANPSWALGAALLAGGALLASVVVWRTLNARVTVVAAS